jgi:prepilin-type N-terminal cleavage/methylation domain-containing protein
MKNAGANKQSGFSLLELMIVLLVLSVMMGSVFTQIRNVQARSAAEQTKLDMFQESREFMDQLQRDLHEAGYPNVRNFGPTAVAGITDAKNAVGLVKVDVNELWFEADVDGDGQVESVQYQYDGSSTGCPCLKRSQVAKIAGSPLTGQGSSFQTEVQNVQNGTSIFTAYKADGTQVTLPVDIESAPTTIANIKTIRIQLNVQSKQFDLQTRQFPQVTLSNTVTLNNCSQAPVCTSSGVCGPGGGMPMSCE